MYAIVDVETTGLAAERSKITDIAIFIHDGKKIVDEFCTLINPECSIPPRITMLTGISDEMVIDAPKFYEVAKEIFLKTENMIFVAHNAGFDYGMIRAEFKRLGGTFQRKKLCTVRLSRKMIPGLRSYGLGNLTNSLGIKITGRHRAEGDARATVELFERLLERDKDGFIEKSLNVRSREATLPPNLSREVFDAIPEETGVYYFLDETGKIIYVGKANNIKGRVLSHFRGGAQKPFAMLTRIHHINYELAGNELVALLLESDEIKKHYPIYNRSQKRTNNIFGICAYEDKKGYMHFGYNNLKLISDPLATFYNITEARSFLLNLKETYNLCPKLCSLQTSPSACFDFHIKKCRGACCSKENPSTYNLRFKKAMKKIGAGVDSYLIIGKGRTVEESSVIMVEDGKYEGFGYLDKDIQIDNFEQAHDYIKPYKDNRDVQRILRTYLRKTSGKNIIEKSIEE
ncbi:MAG TPA: DNA polymerase III subunit epsilon [Flavobacteriales bacterium]|nr:DNA polymerase III subunit epsilon [Flavobacteriales bacterium]